MKRIVKDMAEEILQDFTNCYNAEDGDHVAKMIEKFASDVAREIFEEIEKMLNTQAIIVCETRKTVMKADESPLSYMAMLDGRIYSIRVVEEHIAELKKKYTESEKDDDRD